MAPKPQTRETLRSWDRRAIEEFAIPGVVLMENAGAGAARGALELARAEPDVYREPWWIVCGPGNNGGDGLVVARHLHNRGSAVRILLSSVAFPPHSEAAIQHEIVRRMELPVDVLAGTAAESAGVLRRSLGRGTVIDALFGTGLSRPLAAPYRDWIEAMNASRSALIALDIPSGLDSDTGAVLGAAVRARDTFTFAAPKVGFYRAEGPAHVGRVQVVDIGMPREIWEGG